MTANFLRPSQRGKQILLAGLGLEGLAALVLFITSTSFGVAQQPSAKNQPPPPDRCAGLPTRSEIANCYNSNTAEFERLYASWLQGFARSGVDVSSLDRLPITADALPPTEDLPSTIAHADLIIKGSVKRLDFQPRRTLVTLQVDSVIKDLPGRTPGDVVVSMPGGPVPGLGQDYTSQDFAHAILDYAEYAPIMVQGESAILMLKPTNLPGQSFRVIPHVGQYRLVGGRVEPLDRNPFGQTVNRLPEAEFGALVRSLVR